MIGEKSEECIHGLDVRWCATCLHGPEVQSIPVPLGQALKARYQGVCDGCELPILVDQTIQRWSDDTYRHAGGRCNP